MDGLRIYRFPYFYPTRHQKLCYEGGVLENIKRSWLARIQIPLLFFFEFIYGLRIALREDIDAIHSHWILPSGLVAALVKSFRRTRHLATAHAADILVINRSFLGRLISDFVVNRSEAITSDGSHVRQRLLAMMSPAVRAIAEERIVVQPMGVDIQAFAPRDVLRGDHADDGFNLLFVGRFAEKKGICYLLESVRMLVSDYPQTTLLLAGSGPLEENIREDVKRLNIGDHVKFMGWVGRERLPELYASSDVVVVPSIVTASGDTEGMPTAIVEALAAGKPVVASDVSGIRDVVKHGYNGYLVKEKRPEEIAARVEELMTDPMLHERLSENAVASSKDYDWAVVGRRYAELISG